MSDRALVVSIDGVGPRWLTPDVAPNLAHLARQGASCFTAQTVLPSVTLPAHMSMLRGVGPDTHGVSSNDPCRSAGDEPSLLCAARTAGLRTAAIYNWQPLDAIFTSSCTDSRVVVGSGYEPDEDGRVVRAAGNAIADGHDLVFAYLGAVDLVGHAEGWGSEAYVSAIGEADAHLGRLLDHVDDTWHVVVTTDHGGTGHDHGAGLPADTETFVVARSPDLAPCSGWAHASILDVAPTVAVLLGVDTPMAWEGRSLVGTEELLVDVLLDLLAASAAVTYGERVTMLEHSMQTAAVAAADGADDDLVAAALLHDVGHLLGDAGRWGLPSHAEVGARALQPLLSPSIVEPIRLHVDAKRWLVATDPEYHGQLSEASVATLAQQGGPFDASEIEAFEAMPGHERAARLRRYDDSGKVEGIEIPPLDHYRPLLEDALRPSRNPSAAWLRDACRCQECRDPGNDQHLLDGTELIGWRTASYAETPNGIVAELRRGDEVHRCEIPAAAPAQPGQTLWRADHRAAAVNWASADAPDRAAIALDRHGIGLITGLATQPGTVLEVGRTLGYVRETNYGSLFDVEAVPDPTNLAYTSVGLPLHTDNPYRDPCPTVQLLHCLEAADDGGASRFADGFAVAEHLRTQDPAAFDLLSTVSVSFRYHGDGGDLRADRPIIEVDPDGRVRAVSVNHRSMEAPRFGSADRADGWYDAYHRFAALLASPEFVIELTLLPGDLIAFDNRRVLHGRAAFELTARRHLQGCYIDMDAVRSRARVAGAAG